MSATLKYDISYRLRDLLKAIDRDIFDCLNIHDVSRYAGSRDRRHCACFSLKLPRHVGTCVRLIEGCLRVERYGASGTLRNSAALLRKYIAASLGLPFEGPEDERGFIDSIMEEPHETVNWMAYADWLSERGDYERKRGDLIRGWMAKKALEMQSNGRIPTLALEAEYVRIGRPITGARYMQNVFADSVRRGK